MLDYAALDGISTEKNNNNLFTPRKLNHSEANSSPELKCLYDKCISIKPSSSTRKYKANKQLQQDEELAFQHAGSE